jgi:glutaredoxin
MMGSVSRVTVMTRQGCGLCVTAEQAVARICDELGVAWSLADVDTDPQWRAEYGDLVPVVLVDGEVHGYWKVDEDRLRRTLGA